MNTLDIQMRLLDVIELREATAIKMQNNSCVELVKKYRELDKEMNDLIKDLAGRAQRRTVNLEGITITSGIDAKELAEAVNYYADKKEAAPEVPVQKQLEANFSPYTGEKLRDICPNCWVKDNKPYNCGYDKCPGYKLFKLEKSKS